MKHIPVIQNELYDLLINEYTRSHIVFFFTETGGSWLN